MFIAGLTGNYGMGKSFVLSLFRELGAATIDSDGIVDSLLREKKVLDYTVKLLGPGVVDEEGNLDRKEVAERIFNDPVSKKGLEAFLHPMVFERMDRLIDSVKEKNRIIIVEVPLLFEGNYRARFRKVITVYADEETALKRLEDGGVPRSGALLRLNSQMPIGRKKEMADYTIDNNGSREDTRQQVKTVYMSLLEDMKKRP